MKRIHLNCFVLSNAYNLCIINVGDNMNIYFCSSEAYPYSKSGGLADVAASLPKTLHNHGHNPKVFIPLYKHNIKDVSTFKKLYENQIKFSDQSFKVTYYEATYDEVTYILIRNDKLFARVNYYGYEDDVIRFAFFNHAILTYIALSQDIPDIIHINDWQTSLLPFLLDTRYKKSKQSDLYQNIKTLLTIHNLEKQGSFPLEFEPILEHKNFTYMHMNRINCLKTGIMRAHAINTVSESYREDILTRFYAFSLQAPLKSREPQLFGILNGFDESIHDPKISDYLIQTYDEHTFEIGKKYNKKALLEKLGFTYDANKPVISFINRFAKQKGIDLLMEVMDDYLDKDAFYFVILGKGEPSYTLYFNQLKEKYPNLVYVQNSFDIELSHQVYAASDLFLLPSLFEPCGLNQMIAMKFGALPIIRLTGGLKDTVTPYNKFTGVGSGFGFKNNDDLELKDTIDQALDLYHNHKETFNDLIHQAMHIHHPMDRMAEQYEKLYKKLIDNEI